MKGSAGASIGLLSVSSSLPWAVQQATEIGKELMSKAIHGVHGWSWDDGLHVLPLLGLAHGGSGIGYAFVLLYRATGDLRFRYAAAQAFRYEASWFSPVSATWPDLRHPAAERFLRAGGWNELQAAIADGAVPLHRHRVMEAWCHGAPGIALARLASASILCDRQLEAQVDAAIAATLSIAQRMQRTELRSLAYCSLCHGLAGIGLILRLAGAERGSGELLSEAESAICIAAEQADAPRLHINAQDSGLMLGDAGVAWALLTLHDATLPNLLLPPTDASVSGHSNTEEAIATEVKDALSWFGRSIRVFRRLGVLGDLPRGPQPMMARDKLSEVARTAPEQVRNLLMDALRPELEASTVLPTAEQVAASRLSTGYFASFARARTGVRLIRCEWDWDAWLETVPGAAPVRRARWFAVIPELAGGRLAALTDDEATQARSAVVGEAILDGEALSVRSLLRAGVLEPA